MVDIVIRAPVVTLVIMVSLVATMGGGIILAMASMDLQ
jgi:hypothetical protein